MSQSKDQFDDNFTREDEIMMWALLSEIYFKYYEPINNFDELYKKYLELWDDPEKSAIMKRAIKYFYIYRKAVLNNNSDGFLFEQRTNISQKEIEFYKKYSTNPMSKIVLNRIVENNGDLDYVDNVILHLGAGCYYPSTD